MKKILAFILLSFTLFSCSNKNSKLFELVDSDHTGIDFNNQIKETKDFNVLTDEYIFNGGGVAASDFNNDGKIDLFFTGNQVSNKLYINQGDLNLMMSPKKQDSIPLIFGQLELLLRMSMLMDGKISLCAHPCTKAKKLINSISIKV